MANMDDGYSMCYNEWALDTDIKNELGLLCIISSLTAEKGYCYASNMYLANLFNTNEQVISRRIKKLENKGYINIKYEKRGCEIRNREIRLPKKATDDCQNKQSTIAEKGKENITSINNTSNEYIYSVPDELKEEFDEYLKMRKMMKKPLTNQAIRRALNKLSGMSSSIEEQKMIITQSIDHCWLDLYPLKDTGKPVYDTSKNEEVSDEDYAKLLSMDDGKRYDTSKNKKISEEELDELLKLRGTDVNKG